MKGEQLNLDFRSSPKSERTVSVFYTDEAGRKMWSMLVPTGLTFGRGSWWLEANDEAGKYVRVRMTTIESIQKVAV